MLLPGMDCRSGNATLAAWMTRMAALFGWMTPGELKHFPLAERDAASAWATAGD